MRPPCPVVPLLSIVCGPINLEETSHRHYPTRYPVVPGVLESRARIRSRDARSAYLSSGSATPGVAWSSASRTNSAQLWPTHRRKDSWRWTAATDRSDVADERSTRTHDAPTLHSAPRLPLLVGIPTKCRHPSLNNPCVACTLPPPCHPAHVAPWIICESHRARFTHTVGLCEAHLMCVAVV